LFKGLPEKLTNEVKKLAPKHMKVIIPFSITLKGQTSCTQQSKNHVLARSFYNDFTGII